MSRIKETAAKDPMRLVDAVFAGGPDSAAVASAQARLRAVMRMSRLQIYYDVLPRSPVGPVYVATTERGLVALDFNLDEKEFVARLERRTRAGIERSSEPVVPALRQVQEYLSGKRSAFDLPLDLGSVSSFQRQVLEAALKIPRGQYRTYHQVAAAIGKPKAARAVGQALGHNPVPLVIPCHRVLGSDGSLHGYSGGGGLKTKAWLLRLEGVHLPGLG